MSSLIVEVCEIDKVSKHPSADRLEICFIKGWENISKIGQFSVGDKVVFIPPDTLVPRALAEKWGVVTYLAGKPEADMLRVRSVRLRGEISYGLTVVCENPLWEVGKDVSEYYGLKKYDPPVRGGSNGSLNGGYSAPVDISFSKLTDIENIRNRPNTFYPGQKVVVTEKIDGSAAAVGISKSIYSVESADAEIEQEFYPFTDLSDDDCDFAVWKARSHNINRKRPKTTEEIKKNAFWFPYLNDNIYDMIEYLFFVEGYRNIQLWGEVLGPGISGGSKVLHYGVKDEYQFFAYALKLDDKKISFKRFLDYCRDFEVTTVPILYIMPYNFELIKEYSKGDSLLAEDNGVKHMREGAVVCSYDDDCSIAKFLNPDYLILKEEGKVEDFTDM